MRLIDRVLGGKSVDGIHWRLVQLLLLLVLSYSVVTGLPQTWQKIRALRWETSRYDGPELRARHNRWYKSHRECLASIAATVPTDATVLLQVENVTHWVAPYYLAPRRFLYYRPELAQRFRERGLDFYVLRLWRGQNRIEWTLERSPSGTEAKQ